MDGKVSTVFVGIGGYGDLYPSLYEKYEEIRALCRPVGVVDPYAEKAPHFGWFREQGIPIYDTLEDFYKEHTAQLAVIATPIPLHKPQAACALEQGSHVLCEKPLVPCLADADFLSEKAAAAGRLLGVGFQWSFSRSMNRLKADILAGRFGKPQMLKSLICWKRGRAYYESSGWKGRIHDATGQLIRDSVVTNATAHYLHNIFFVLGNRPDRAAMPTEVEAQVLRAKDIQSFDTCILKGDFPNGGAFWYGATHSGDGDDQTRFLYQFEKGTVYFNERPEDPGNHMVAVFSDGSVEDYGDPQAFPELAPKFLTMLEACRRPETPVPCTAETVRPHLAVCQGLFEKAEIRPFPADRVFAGGEPEGVYVRGLSDWMLDAYAAAELPCRMESTRPYLPHSDTFRP